MTFETEPSAPLAASPLPSEAAVFPDDSAPSDPLPLPVGSATGRGDEALRVGEGRFASPLTPSRPADLTPSSVPSSLPLSIPSSLSPSDLSLLTTYTELHFNPSAVAKHHKLPLLEVLTWLNAEHIRPHLREIRKAFALSFKLSADQSRHTVIDALEDVINTTEDLVEKRRAATTLLRALNPQRRRRTNIHSTGTPANPSSPSSSRSSCPSCSTPSRLASPSAIYTYASPSAAAAQFDHEAGDDSQDSRPAPSPSYSASPLPAPEGRTTVARGEAERNPWIADPSPSRPEGAEKTDESINARMINACVTRFGTADQLISLLSPDGTINLDRLNELAAQIDNEDDEDSDTESEDEPDDEADEDQPDDFQDPHPPVRTSSRRSVALTAAHNTS